MLIKTYFFPEIKRSFKFKTQENSKHPWSYFVKSQTVWVHSSILNWCQSKIISLCSLKQILPFWSSERINSLPWLTSKHDKQCWEPCAIVHIVRSLETTKTCSCYDVILYDIWTLFFKIFFLLFCMCVSTATLI